LDTGSPCELSGRGGAEAFELTRVRGIGVVAHEAVEGVGDGTGGRNIDVEGEEEIELGAGERIREGIGTAMAGAGDRERTGVVGGV